MAEDLGADLARVIKGLREQFTQALADGTAGEIDFAVGEITLDFQVAVTDAVDGKVGARFWVLSTEAAAKREKALVHHLTVRLTPGRRRPDGTVGPMHVADKVDGRPG